MDGLLAGLGWEALEHVLDVAVEHAGVLVGVGGEVLGGETAPEEVLGVALEEVDDEVAYGLIGCGGGSGGVEAPGIAQATPAPSAPTPTAAPAAAESVVHGLDLLLVLDFVEGEDGDGAVGGNELPSLGLELCVDGLLNAGGIEGIRGFYLAPGVGVVLGEVGGVVVVGANVAGKCCDGGAEEESGCEWEIQAEFHEWCLSAMERRWCSVCFKIAEDLPSVVRSVPADPVGASDWALSEFGRVRLRAGFQRLFQRRGRELRKK